MVFEESMPGILGLNLLLLGELTPKYLINILLFICRIVQLFFFVQYVLFDFCKVMKSTDIKVLKPYLYCCSIISL